MDDEILKTVESMLGKDIKIVDCEKTSSIREEEVLLINGIPVQLEGDDGLAIKSALMTGQVPPCDLLNQLLYRAGIIRKPVHLETSLSVKSSVIRKEEVTVARDGRVLNERTSETQEQNIYTSSCQEIWEPIDKLGTLKTFIPISIDRYLMSSEGGECGDAFLSATPDPNLPLSPILSAAIATTTATNSPSSSSSSTSHDKFKSANYQNRSRNNQTGGDSTEFMSSTSSISINVGDESGELGRRAGETTISSTNRLMYGPSSQSSLAKSFCPNAPGRPILSNTQTKGPDPDDDDDEKRKLINCMSYDSGHDEFFESSSNSNFLASTSAANFLSCDSERYDDDNYDVTNESGTDHRNHRRRRHHHRALHMYPPHSNSISSSCYDFVSSSSDETDRRSSCSSSTASITKERMPTIFGTVASDQCPKDNTNRKGFPQTTTTNGNSSRTTSEKSHSAKNVHQSTSSSKQATNNTSISASAAPSTNNQPNSPAHQQRGDVRQGEHQKQRHNQNQNKYHHQESADENALVYRDGNLISGPLDTLIQHMVPTADYYPDRSYLFAFLLSARLFIRPHELLARICQLCDEQQDLTGCRCCAGSGGGDDIVDFTRHHSHSHASSLHQNSDTSISSTVSGTGNAKSLNSTSSMVGGEIECCGKLRQFSQNFVRLLAEWIDTFPYDFRDERLMQHVRSMTRKCIAIDSSLRKDVQTMLQNLLQRLTVLEKYEEFLLTLSQNGGHNSENTVDGPISQDSNAMTTVTAAANSKSSSVLTIQNNLHGGSITDSTIGGGQPIGGSNTVAGAATSSGANHNINAGSSSSVDISELCSSPSLLAHQLTHIELERLSYIGPEEFVQAFAKENPHLEQSFSDMKKTRNLESYVQWFNRLSYLVATEIVKHPKKKQRVRIVEYWIETGRECFNIGNFNSLMAIIAGLNMSPISRLKKTWAKVQTAKFSVLEHQMDPSSNFNSYRSTLKAAMWRSAGATDERERIVIPFFSLLVKDLYFLNEGCSNKLSNGHINFEKFWQLAKQVTEFIAWKQVTCPFDKLPKVIMFLQTNHILNENTLAIASFECEPPENNHEKDRFKSLKSEQQQQQHSLNHHHQCQ